MFKQVSSLLFLFIFICLIGFITLLFHNTELNNAYTINTQQQQQHMKELEGHHDNLVMQQQQQQQKRSDMQEDSLRLWSSDFHISPIADIKFLFSNFSKNWFKSPILVTDKSLSGHCHLMKTCQHDLRVINQYNGIELNPCPNQLRRDFYDSYREDKEMLQMDGFLCNHAASMCELFMPFGKPMIVIASTRYEIGRLDAKQWQRWNDNLKLIASNPYNTIAANNKYDQEYIKYFTGLRNVLLLPSYCNYVGVTYLRKSVAHSGNNEGSLRGSPVINLKSQYLLAPSRGIHPYLQMELFQALRLFNAQQQQQQQQQQTMSITISPIRDLYPHYEYHDLVAHPGIILLPYQVSLMSVFEYYRMEIPIFVPSPELLTDWHLQYNVLKERTWAGVYDRPVHSSLLPRHPNSISSYYTDPNNEFNRSVIMEWIQLADFYQWPFIQQFHNWKDLFKQLTQSNTNTLIKISKDMTQYNQQVKEELKKQWYQILSRIQQRKVERMYHEEALHDDINEQLNRLYHYKLSSKDCHHQLHES